MCAASVPCNTWDEAYDLAKRGRQNRLANMSREVQRYFFGDRLESRDILIRLLLRYEEVPLPARDTIMFWLRHYETFVTCAASYCQRETPDLHLFGGDVLCDISIRGEYTRSMTAHIIANGHNLNLPYATFHRYKCWLVCDTRFLRMPRPYHGAHFQVYPADCMPRLSFTGVYLTGEQLRSLPTN